LINKPHILTKTYFKNALSALDKHKGDHLDRINLISLGIILIGINLIGMLDWVLAQLAESLKKTST